MRASGRDSHQYWPINGVWAPSLSSLCDLVASRAANGISRSAVAVFSLVVAVAHILNNDPRKRADSPRMDYPPKGGAKCRRR